MIEQYDARRLPVREQMARAGHAGLVVVRGDGRGDRRRVCELRVDGDDGNARRPRRLERRPHLLVVDGCEEQHLDALVDEGADRLCLAFDGERGVAGEEHVAVVLDTGADLLVDDFIERIVQRHVDGAEAVAVLVVAQAEILRPPAEEAEQAADHEERGEGDEQ